MIICVIVCANGCYAGLKEPARIDAAESPPSDRGGGGPRGRRAAGVN